MSDEFERWYTAHFADMPEWDDEEYKVVVHKLWSLIIDQIARNVEISVFEDVSGEAVAAMIRAMK